jgi:hypothetical protein
VIGLVKMADENLQPPNGDDDYRVAVTATIQGNPDSVLRQMLVSKANTQKSIRIELQLKKPPTEAMSFIGFR